MADLPGEDEYASAAEAKLRGHMELVRLAPPQSSTALTRAVLRTLSWQRAVAGPLGAIAAIAAGALGALRGLMARRRR